MKPPRHIRCKQDASKLCKQADELYKDVFGDLPELFKTVPSSRMFEKGMR